MVTDNSITSRPNARERPFSAVFDLGVDKRSFKNDFSGRIWAADISIITFLYYMLESYYSVLYK